MSALCHGYEIVCPDGVVRHYPYHNKGDADCDAGLYSPARHGCGLRKYDALKPDDPRGLCPQGDHAVRPVAFAHPEHSERGSA